MSQKKVRILPIIVLAQFFCTSSWFAVNAVIDNIPLGGSNASFMANATIAIQIGFIIGTLMFAIFGIVDRFSPSKVFFCCSLMVAVVNLVIAFAFSNIFIILLSRFIIGFFLAGIYPVGMKIASDHFEKGLGRSLGFLVGALVLGTSFPHFLKAFTLGLSWQFVIYGTSFLSILGGAAILVFVPNGPFKSPGQKVQFGAVFDGFKNKDFKSAAFGYFGHMCELYTFWAFLPLILKEMLAEHGEANQNVSFMSFVVIASGSVACILVGIFSPIFEARKIATICLLLSCICCLLSPYLLHNGNLLLGFSFLIFWGMVVVADSPLFSTLVATHAPTSSKGTAITIVTCIGFTITILSIKFLTYAGTIIDPKYLYTFLSIGPILGLLKLIRP